MDLMHVLHQHKIIAIFRGVPGEAADRAAEALIQGGIRLLEVTMNTAGGMALLSGWREKFDGRAYFGAGTVLDLAMAKTAVAAGAQFLVSPNLDEEVVRYGAEQGIDVFPGVMTPTEIVRAWKAGARAVKLFPMASLGLPYLKEVCAPLDHIPMIPTGGISLDNMRDFLQAGAAGLGIGSHLVNKRLIAEGRFDELEATARKFAEAVKTGTATS